MSDNCLLCITLADSGMDTWDPLVPGPELAIDTVNGRSCLAYVDTSTVEELENEWTAASGK